MKLQKILVVSVLACGGALLFAGCSVASASLGGGTSGSESRDPSEVAGDSAASGSGEWGSGGMSGVIGAACVTNEDCGSVLTCFGPDHDDPSFGGGPAGGFCSRSCSKNEDCPGVNGVCLKDDDSATGSCTIACTIGPPLARDYAHPLDADKCSGRPDVRCEKVKNLGAVCLPTCGSDAECGPDRACDPNRAVCVSKKIKGLPTGAACDASTKPTTCAGRCLSFDVGSAICSSPCALGGSLATSSDCGGPTKGLCAFGPDSNGPGDVGYCTPSCTAHSDCANPGFWCFHVTGLMEAVDHGYCFGATSCKGQSDCSQPGQASPYTCTSTPKGSFCLDSSFPFEKKAGPVP